MAKKILIIEDDEFLRNLMVRRLEKEGFETAEASNGKTGLEKSKTEKPDLILLDLILPGIDGSEVLVEIKKNPATASIPVIIITNLDQKENNKETRDLAVDYLIKAQLDPIEITERIKKVLNP
ncbi:MAG: hypothetical protein A2998_01290 [Candidatus Staskawiczbacteria bacterium RIFCSPLOWO2_01_FULL_37_25b]|uniref:Response regulatory domain-containing protein n=2 Tax=Candidatus Staskawicziibacteriota TaxID=1817916 RepID=A0A1G2HP22_9BACT|nr:MAG: hypothetical protein A2812_02205 [Candidatus Staskawiczbacteria bacterium RIFCSPHIGHO2_01_FULL_36_16]OGZ73412.1 MAG: hypothetical protein A2998_01290 [Candidatus Staskawiczbacteria bacterium RIFCSPLOWO2_01_FULL_37_25b]